MNWGKSIILTFVLFGGFIGTLVTICATEDISLVTKDYYQEELAYQGQIDRMAHTAMLEEKPTISVEDGGMLKVSYADLFKLQEGTLELFRPSDARLDKQFLLQKTRQSFLYFSTAGMPTGMYRARLRWSMDGEDFFIEQKIQF